MSSIESPSLKGPLRLRDCEPDWRREALSICIGTAGLLIDRIGIHWYVKGEYIVDAIVWSIFVTIFSSSERQGKLEMIAVLLVFTPAEFCFTEGPVVGGPHYYSYMEGEQHRLMPLFVPPGHWCLLDLGRRISKYLPLEKTHLTWALIAPLVPATIYLAVTGVDTCGIIFLLFLCAFLRWGPQPRLYATMTWLALLMEIEGTRFGNWEWHKNVPFPVGWTVLNPPLLIGAGYAFFDLIINVSTGLASRRQLTHSEDFLLMV